MNHRSWAKLNVMLCTLGATWASGADLNAVRAERLFAPTTTEVRRFLRMPITIHRLSGGGALLILGVLGKVEPATTAEADVIFVLASASRANLHRILNVIMPEIAAERRGRTVVFKDE
jgi:hypothetical protein